jgi:hypothetical protein
MRGNRVMEVWLQQNVPGTFKKDIEIAPDLQPGLYIMRAGPTLNLTKKIVVQ